MIPVFLSEPVTLLKRRHTGEVLSEPKKQELPLVAPVKGQLRALRQHSLDNLESLVKELQTSLNRQSHAHVHIAANASEAGDSIRQICGSTRTIAINKSAVVIKEIVPLLGDSFRIIDSYFDQFPPFQTRFQDYWELPSIPFHALDLSFPSPINLNPIRREHLEQHGARDFVGLLGVGAASAAEGSLFMLQHANNIADIFRKAKTLILVVGLDKVTSRVEDAIFQAKCMGLFGAEARLLDLQRPGERGPNLDEFPLLPPGAEAEEMHVILLDNGRRNILASPYKDLLSCINCRGCLRGCPTYKYFRTPVHWSPEVYIYFHALGPNSSLDLCVQCGLCRSYCPLEIDIPGLIAFSRSQKHHALIDKMLANFETVAQGGRTVRFLSNTFLRNRPIRRMVDSIWGLSQNRRLPDFQPELFSSWFKKRKG